MVNTGQECRLSNPEVLSPRRRARFVCQELKENQTRAAEQWVTSTGDMLTCWIDGRWKQWLCGSPAGGDIWIHWELLQPSQFAKGSQSAFGTTKLVLHSEVVLSTVTSRISSLSFLVGFALRSKAYFRNFSFNRPKRTIEYGTVTAQQQVSCFGKPLGSQALVVSFSPSVLLLLWNGGGIALDC